MKWRGQIKKGVSAKERHRRLVQLSGQMDGAEYKPLKKKDDTPVVIVRKKR